MSDDDDFEGSSGKGGGLWLLWLLLFPLFLVPVVALLYYSMLRHGRQRLSVVALVAVSVSTVTVILGSLFDVFISFTNAVKGVLSLQFDVWSMVPALLVVNVVLGSVLGVGIVWWEIRSIRSSPHRLELNGSWTYQFQYRKTPWEVLRRRRLIEKLKSGAEFSEERAPLGLDEEKDKIVYRYSSESFKHTMVTGAPGSGKTITLLSLILNDITAGVTTVIIDFKRSPELASKVSRFARENGAEFYHFVNGEPESYDIDNSRGQSFYDCLSSGSPTSRADMVLGMREYDTASAVYKSSMQQLLQVVFAALAQADRSKAPNIDWRSGGIYQLASVVRGRNLQELASACEGKKVERDIVEVYEASNGKTQIRHALEELQGQMRTIIASEYGQWMKTSGTDKDIELYELTSRPGNVILFSLNSDSEKEFAQYVGSMIMSDLTAVSARRRNNADTNPVRVYVDEFQAVNPESVKSLLEKSRESKMAITLAQQSFEQVITASERNGEAYLGALLDTCSNFVIHAGATEDSAVKLSKILGKHWVPVYRGSHDHEGFFLSLNWKNRRHQKITSSKEERWIFGPSRFMRLQSPDPNNSFKSTAVVINKTSADPEYSKKGGGAVAREVWMIPCDKVLESVYQNASHVRTDARISPVATEDDFDELDALDRFDEHYSSGRFDDLQSTSRNTVVPTEQTDPFDDGGFVFEDLEPVQVDRDAITEDNQVDVLVLDVEPVEPVQPSEPSEPEQPRSNAVKAVERMSSFEVAMQSGLGSSTTLGRRSPRKEAVNERPEQLDSTVASDDDDFDLPEL